MGFFSWNCAKSNNSIPAPDAELKPELSHVVLVLPDDKVFAGMYNGYGGIDLDNGEGHVDIYEALAPYYFNNSNATRDSVFSNIKYITAPDGKETVIVLFNWEEPIARVNFVELNMPEIIGKTLNQLNRENYKIDTDFDRVQKLIKLVRFDQYTGETFKELKPSKSCRAQGFFYSGYMRKKLNNSIQ